MESQGRKAAADQQDLPQGVGASHTSGQAMVKVGEYGGRAGHVGGGGAASRTCSEGTWGPRDQGWRGSRVTYCGAETEFDTSGLSVMLL